MFRKYSTSALLLASAITLASSTPARAQGTAGAGARGGRAGAGSAPRADAARPDTIRPDSTRGRAGSDSSEGGRGNPLGALAFRSIGPALTSGRVADIAVHPRDKHTWYVAAASGGVWKTVNAGTTWTPVFDGEGSYSIATVVIDPVNPNVVWVGTGENNAQRSVSYGDGVYKSVDGGRSWTNVGLRESEHIGKIVIDPRNTDVVYVAAQGPLSVKGGERGLYKTTDGGKSWTKVLGPGTWAGVSDVVLDPRNPDHLLATTWQRIRRTYGYVAGGPESGLWRSTDGGASWRRSQSGLPNEELGRIGLAVSPANPDVVYAEAEAAQGKGGFFRSRDGGASWERMSGFNTIGLYYEEIFADPVNVDRVYAVDVRTMVTDDAGRTFRPLGERNKHVDNHAVWIDPDDNQHLLIGCDGGLYESFDRGQSYRFFANLPLTQFYKIDVDNARPFYHVYGGTQDNFSLGGAARTRTEHGITNADWFVTAGGDGFQSRADPKDATTVYAESQHGNLQRFNLATGESVDIQPQSEPNESPLRWYWDSPLIVSPHLNTRLYFGSQRLYRSDDRGNSWRAVSPDLSRQIDRNRLPLMGRVQSVDAVAKNTSSSFYGEIVTIAESPLREGQLWVGTDDGTLQVSENGGQSWRKIDRFPGVPDTSFVSRVTPSSHDANTVYASFDNHWAGDYAPYLVKSTDLGRSWTSIAGNLPRRGTVYVVIDDPKQAGMLYAGTEFGLYVSRDGGQRWTRLRAGLPTIPVFDLAIQKRDDDLVVATFGRGIYVLDDLEPLRAMTPAVLASAGALLPVRRTPLFVEASPLGGSGVSFQGGAYFSAPNPPFGATFTYYLKDALRTRRERRQEAERAAVRRGGDVPYPAWDSLRAEDRELAPAVTLTVSDAEGRVVRRLAGPVTAGTHRVTWDLRYPAPNPPRAVREGGAEGAPESESFGRTPQGPPVVPGTYTVALTTRIDGTTQSLGTPQRFEVYMLDGDAAARTPAVLAFQQKTAALQRAVLGANAAATEAMTDLQALERALVETPAASDSLLAATRALEVRLRDLQESLAGDPTMSRRQEPAPPSLLARVNGIAGSTWGSSLDAPTATATRQYEIAAAEFGGVLDRLRTLVEGDVRALETRAEAAGAPWTAGRIPTWKP